MQYATVTLTWDDQRVHPIDDIFARHGEVEVVAIRYVSPVHEGRYVELAELRGDLDAARELLESSPDALEYDIAGTGEQGLAYIQCRTAGLVDDLLAILHEHEIVLDWPMQYLDEGTVRGLQLTVLGTSQAIQQAAATLPDGIRLDLERMGEYEPGDGNRSAVLTEKQQALLDLAVREGYYEVPRETTHRELADELGKSAGTISERLQRIEAKLVAASVPSR
ncbi:helix-turn-helix domain-containing protein [Halorussus halophilus]|uniref:helix-turn-helix domain-containing protein n=1 Tax=Halorussus halophilus TaxID=2650975 RepID=UPI0013016537|nr:helix-turn-helix domain-containing protein [Halorussus halophilus]